eukprot:TRINITY_DN8208_c0_g2_i1.p1 TRINITY_DN8208_c0_g2~~TRINITY_DN8208_c0_g2_i1.p1  ORF type:complete len:1477 (+),score=445.73 TRINITY_DN8208_c0_g2_i1:589-4431(+)
MADLQSQRKADNRSADRLKEMVNELRQLPDFVLDLIKPAISAVSRASGNCSQAYDIFLDHCRGVLKDASGPDFKPVAAFAKCAEFGAAILLADTKLQHAYERLIHSLLALAAHFAQQKASSQLVKPLDEKEELLEALRGIVSMIKSGAFAQPGAKPIERKNTASRGSRKVSRKSTMLEVIDELEADQPVQAHLPVKELHRAQTAKRARRFTETFGELSEEGKRKAHTLLQQQAVERADKNSELARDASAAIGSLLDQQQVEREEALQNLLVDHMQQMQASPGRDAQARLRKEHERKTVKLRKKLASKHKDEMSSLLASLADSQASDLKELHARHVEEATACNAQTAMLEAPSASMQSAELEELERQQRLLLLEMASARAEVEPTSGEEVDERMAAFAERLNQSRLGTAEPTKVESIVSEVKQEIESIAATAEKQRKRLRKARAKVKGGSEAAEIQDIADELAAIDHTEAKLQEQAMARALTKALPIGEGSMTPEEAKAMVKQLTAKFSQAHANAQQKQESALKAALAAKRMKARQKQRQEQVAEEAQGMVKAHQTVQGHGKKEAELVEQHLAEQADSRRAQLEAEHLKRLEQLQLESQQKQEEIDRQLEQDLARLEAASREQAEQMHLNKRNALEAEHATQLEALQEKHGSDSASYAAESQQLAQEHAKRMQALDEGLASSRKTQDAQLQARLKQLKARKKAAAAKALEISHEKELLQQATEASELERELHQEAEAKVIATDIVTGNSSDVEASVHALLEQRHVREETELGQRLLDWKRVQLDEAMHEFDQTEADAREELLNHQQRELSEAGQGKPTVIIKHQHQHTLKAFDRKTASRRTALEKAKVVELEAEIAKRRLELREQQYSEIVEMFQKHSPQGELIKQYETLRDHARDMAEEQRRQIAQHTEGIIKQKRKSQAARLQALAEEQEAERKRLQEEEEANRERQERELEEQKRRYEEQLARDQEVELSQATAAQKEAIMQKYRREQRQLMAALTSQRKEQEDALRQKREERRQRRARQKLEDAQRLESQRAAESARVAEEMQARQAARLAQLEQEAQVVKVSTMTAKSVDPILAAMAEEGMSPLAAELSVVEHLVSTLAASDDYVDPSDVALTEPGQNQSVLDEKACRLAEAFADKIAQRLNNVGFPVFTTKLTDDKVTSAYRGNAFRHSYTMDVAANQLRVRKERAFQLGDLMIIVAHAAAHLKAGASFEYDQRPAFRTAFFAALRKLCFDMIIGQLVGSSGDAEDVMERVNMAFSGARDIQSTMELAKLCDTKQ